MNVDDKTLTLFLMGCMTEMFERTIKATDLHMIPGTVQRGLKKDGLKYLEIITGTNILSRVDVYVYSEESREPIFGMNIVSQILMTNVAESHLNFLDVQRVLQNSRKNGFTLTEAAIREDKSYSLFHIPAYKERAPATKNGITGTLQYSEDIDDTLDFFGGGEEISFHPDGHRKPRLLVFRSQIQGCRL